MTTYITDDGTQEANVPEGINGWELTDGAIDEFASYVAGDEQISVVQTGGASYLTMHVDTSDGYDQTNVATESTLDAAFKAAEREMSRNVVA